MKIIEIITSKKFEKQFKRLPTHIKEAASVWILTVQEEGLMETRKIKGYHDEPLKGKWKVSDLFDI